MPYPSLETLPDIASAEYTDRPQSAVAAIMPIDKVIARSAIVQLPDNAHRIIVILKVLIPLAYKGSKIFIYCKVVKR